MIRDRGLKQHRRNISPIQLGTIVDTLRNKKKPKNSTRKSSKKVPKSETKNLNYNDVRSLIQKSMKKVAKKHVIVEEIEEPGQQQTYDNQEFFKFGKKTAKDINIKMPPMEEIEEVPDTGSYSQRNTQGKIQNKQNDRNFYNRYEDRNLRNFKLQLQKIDEKKEEKGPLSQRLIHDRSKRSHLKSSRSHNCSESTVDLIRMRSLKTKSRERVKTAKRNKINNIEKQIKMIWQCMGDLWQNNRITRQISEQNQHYLTELMRKTRSQDRELIDLKLRIDSKTKNA